MLSSPDDKIAIQPEDIFNVITGQMITINVKNNFIIKPYHKNVEDIVLFSQDDTTNIIIQPADKTMLSSSRMRTPNFNNYAVIQLEGWYDS